MPTRFVDSSTEDSSLNVSKLIDTLPSDILEFRNLARSVIGDSYQCNHTCTELKEDEHQEMDVDAHKLDEMNALLERIETIGMDGSTATTIVQIAHERKSNDTTNALFWNSYFEQLFELLLSALLRNEVCINIFFNI